MKEIKIDRFHQNENNIYRILTKDKPSDHYHAHNFGSLALDINQQVSGIESFTRLWELPMQIRTDPGHPIGKYIYLQDDRWSKKQQTYQIAALIEDIPA